MRRRSGTFDPAATARYARVGARGASHWPPPFVSRPDTERGPCRRCGARLTEPGALVCRTCERSVYVLRLSLENATWEAHRVRRLRRRTWPCITCRLPTPDRRTECCLCRRRRREAADA